MSDKIIQEVWQIKDTIGKEVNYNIHSLGVLLQRRQHSGGKKVVDLSRLRKKTTTKATTPVQ